jgi:hypothetical protein
MIKILGNWELGWNAPYTEYDLWEFPLREFEVYELMMVPITGVNRKVTEFSSYEEALNAPENENLTTVVCDERGQTDLRDFIHPKDALYIFGKANYSPLINIQATHSLKISTPQNKGMMWPHQAACIILYDRYLKNDS